MFYHATLKALHEADFGLLTFNLFEYVFMYILQSANEMWHIITVRAHACPTVTTLSAHHMRRNSVMSMTYVLERHRNTDCCPVLSMGAHGALL